MTPKPIPPRRLMTLLTVTPAKGAYILGADSQETCPYYDENGNYHELRKTVQKIEPQTIRNYQVAIAGSGNASLIDSFIVRANRALNAYEGLTTAQSLRELLEGELSDFQARDVPLCADQDKRFRLLIAYFCLQTKEFGVWITENIVLREVRTPELMGDAHELYAELAARLMAADMTMPQAILATLHVLTVAEATSNSIRGPHSIAVIRENGIWMEKPDYITSMTQRLQAFERQVNNIFLACADSSVQAFRLEEMLKEFSQSAVELHKRHIDEQVSRMTVQDLMTTNDAVPHLPPGSIIELNVLRGLQFVHDAERLDAETVRLRSMLQQVKPLMEKTEPRSSESDAGSTPSDSQKSGDQQ